MFDIGEAAVDTMVVSPTSFGPPGVITDLTERSAGLSEAGWVEVPNRTGKRYSGLTIDPTSDIHECDVYLGDERFPLSENQILNVAFDRLRVRIKQPLPGKGLAPYTLATQLQNAGATTVEYGIGVNPQPDPPTIYAGTVRLRMWDESPEPAAMQRVRTFSLVTTRVKGGVNKAEVFRIFGIQDATAVRMSGYWQPDSGQFATFSLYGITDEMNSGLHGAGYELIGGLGIAQGADSMKVSVAGKAFVGFMVQLTFDDATPNKQIFNCTLDVYEDD